MVSDAQAEYRLRKESSQKVEATFKAVGGKGNARQVPKLSGKYRNISRRKTKQQVSRIELIELEEENLSDGTDKDDVTDTDVTDIDDDQLV